MSSRTWMIAATAVLLLLLGTRPAKAFDLFVSEDSDVKKGNALLAQSKPKDALAKYDDAARSLPGRGEVHLDRGLALSRSGDDQLDQAMQAYKLAADSSAPAAVRARALFGLGNAFFKKEDYDGAVEQYKKSLLTAPGNKDVAWNLELALQKKKKQDDKKKQDEQNKKDQQQQDQKQDQQKQDQQDQQDQQKQDQQDQQKQDQQKQDQQDQQKQDQHDQQKQDQPEQEPGAPKPEQGVETLLNALDNNDDNLQRNMARQRAIIPAGPYKDW